MTCDTSFRTVEVTVAVHYMLFTADRVRVSSLNNFMEAEKPTAH